MSSGLVVRLAGYEFKPGLVPSIFFIACLPLFLSLGFWQLQRAYEKTDILAAVEQRKQQPAIAVENIDAEKDLFTPVLLQGSFIRGKQFLLDNRVYQGRAGYEILSPFRLSRNGQIILVSRGWVKTGLSRAVLPDITLGQNLPEQVAGIFTRPSRGVVLGDAFDSVVDTWPKVIQFTDFERIEMLLGANVIPGIVQTSESFGGDYPKIWQPVAFGPEKHYGYALQWFSIAFVLAILYIVLNCKKENQGPND